MASRKTTKKRRHTHSSKRQKNVKSRKVMRGGCDNITKILNDPNCWTEKDGTLKVKPGFENFGVNVTNLTPVQIQQIRLRLNSQDRYTSENNNGLDPFANFDFRK
jgi:hypothetical protein